MARSGEGEDLTPYSRSVDNRQSEVEPRATGSPREEVIRLHDHVEQRAGGRFERERLAFADMDAMWAALHPAFVQAHVDADPVLALAYAHAAAQLPLCDFTLVAEAVPQITACPARPGARPYQVTWAPAASLGIDDDAYSGVLLRFLTHVAAAEMYERHGVDRGELQWANVRLPPPAGPVEDGGLAANQKVSLARQLEALEDNWADLETIEEHEFGDGGITAAAHGHVAARIQVALLNAVVANDAVLAELLYYLQAKDLARSRTYAFARRMLREANQRRQRW